MQLFLGHWWYPVVVQEKSALSSVVIIQKCLITVTTHREAGRKLRWLIISY